MELMERKSKRLPHCVFHTAANGAFGERCAVNV
jgi:hypothetical protein